MKGLQIIALYNNALCGTKRLQQCSSYCLLLCLASLKGDGKKKKQQPSKSFREYYTLVILLFL